MQAKKIEVGDILVSTFGYDARLACFWKVLKRTAKSVTIARLLDHDRTGDWCDGTDAPAKNSRLGETMSKRVKPSWQEGEETFNTGGYGYAYQWDGKPVRTYNHH